MLARSKVSSRMWYSIGAALAVGLLLFSWFVCYLWMMALTEFWGAPWDLTTIRPPVGHWQRSINDFFESGIGMLLPTIVFLTISLLLYARSLVRTRAVLETSLAFGITNLAAMISLLLIVILVQILLIRTPSNLTPADWSYWGDFTREWPLTVIALLWFAGLFMIQPHLATLLEARKLSERLG
jgi:hypothetical protein